MKINKRFKKITFYSLVGVLLMSTVLLCGIIVANASATSGNWNDSGNYTIRYLYKDEDGCYMIESENDLASINKYSSVYFSSSTKLKLYADLDMSAHYWTPASRDFKGTFYGQNHTIKNLFTEYSSSSNPSDYSGLFKKLNGARIYDLKLDTISTTGLYYSGALAGEASSSTISNVEIKDCSIDARNTTLSELSENMYAGGIVGYISGTTIERCKSFNTDVCVSNKINSTSNSTTLIMYAGGIVGFSAPSSDISACRVIDGNVRFYPLGQGSGSIFVADTLYIGGIVGKAINTDIEICSNENTYIEGGVEGNSRLYCSINYAYLGGIAGYLDGSPVTACFNTGEVDGYTKEVSNDPVNTGKSIECSYKFNITDYCIEARGNAWSQSYEYNLYIGGIAGCSNSSFSQCYNYGILEKGYAKDEIYYAIPCSMMAAGDRRLGACFLYKIVGNTLKTNDICGKLEGGTINKCFTDISVWSNFNPTIEYKMVSGPFKEIKNILNWVFNPYEEVNSNLRQCYNDHSTWLSLEGSGWQKSTFNLKTQLARKFIFNCTNGSVTIKCLRDNTWYTDTEYTHGPVFTVGTFNTTADCDCEVGIEISNSGLSSDYYAEDDDVNYGLPHLKEFYWADNTSSY